MMLCTMAKPSPVPPEVVAPELRERRGIDAEEAIKYPGQRFGRYAGAGVGDLNPYLGIGGGGGHGN